MDKRIIESLWKTGVFFDLNERKAPKLINAMKIMKNRDWDNDNDSLDQLLSGFKKDCINSTKKSLLKNICELFDFNDFSELENSSEFNEIIKHLENEGSSTQKMKVASSIFIFDSNNQNLTKKEQGIREEYLENLEIIKNDLIMYKDDQICRDLLEYVYFR
jgi:hypothetical protein